MSDERPVVTLSQRELVVGALAAAGASMYEVAFWLGISAETSKSYLRRARIKFEEVGFRTSTRIELGLAMNTPGSWRLSALAVKRRDQS